MGQSQSGLDEAKVVAERMRLLYDDFILHVAVSNSREASHLSFIKYVFPESPSYVISYSQSELIHGTVIEGGGEIPRSQVKRVLSYSQYLTLRKMAYDIERLVAAGALNELKKDSDECTICMDAPVDIVLPCSHSFCTKCFEVSTCICLLYILILLS